MTSPIWDVPHLSSGSPKPVLDPNQVYVYNMRFCPYAQRTVLVLLDKKVNFNVININLKKKPDWFVAETFGLVPVILYKDDIIPESLITSDLADELFPGAALTPADPVAKAKDRVVLEIFGKVISNFYKTLLAKEDEVAHAALQDLLTAKGKVAAEYKKRGTKFFCGDSPGMLDYMIWPWMERLPCIPLRNPNISLPDCDLDAWVKEMWTTEAVSKYGLTPEQHMTFLAEYRKGDDCNYDILLK